MSCATKHTFLTHVAVFPQEMLFSNIFFLIYHSLLLPRCPLCPRRPAAEYVKFTDYHIITPAY